MREAYLERKLAEAVRKDGGLCWKFVSPQNAGVPDRICIKNGRTVFVEVKRPGEKPRPLQLVMHRRLVQQNMTVCVISAPEDIQQVIGVLNQ